MNLSWTSEIEVSHETSLNASFLTRFRRQAAFRFSSFADEQKLGRGELMILPTGKTERMDVNVTELLVPGVVRIQRGSCAS